MRRRRLAASKNPRKPKYKSRNTIQESLITATLKKESNGPNLLDLKKHHNIVFLVKKLRL